MSVVNGMLQKASKKVEKTGNLRKTQNYSDDSISENS